MDLTNLNKDKKARRRSTDLNTMVYGKVPPQAKDLEQATLGAIMLEGRAFDTVSEILRPECFYVDAHQRVFRAMISLSQKSQPIDLLTVCEELRFREELDAAGGPYYITTLTNSVVSAANIEAHARIVLQKFIQRELIRIGGDLINDAYEDSCDVFELLDRHDKAYTDITTGHLKKNYLPLDRCLVKATQQLEALRQKDERLTGISSGYPDIDRITHGWQDSDLIILAARPSVGKTALALNFARNAALHNVKSIPVGFFSLEMSAMQLTNRLLASESGISLERLITGDADENIMKVFYTQGVQPLSKAAIFIDDTPALTLYDFRSKARSMKRKHNVGMIILDYLQLMSGDSERRGNREQEISNISRGIKALAKELYIPIIALSQLSREPEKRKGDNRMPQLSDLRESGALEQDADVVGFLYRPEYYDGHNGNGESDGETQISFAKNRNGKRAFGRDAIKLRADLAIQKFYAWDHLAAVQQQLRGAGWRPVKLPYNDDDELPFDDEKD